MVQYSIVKSSKKIYMYYYVKNYEKYAIVWMVNGVSEIESL